MRPATLLLFVRFALFLVVGVSGLNLRPCLAADLPNRVVCVTGDNSAFVNNAEGYERKRAAQGLAAKPPAITRVTFQVGGNFAECLARVTTGDQLILITHGDAGTFTWNDGKGNGDDLYADFNTLPLPDGFATLTNVAVGFVSSRSCSPPAGGNDQRSSCSKILDAMNGGRKSTANTCSGFDNSAFDYFVIDVDAADKNNPASDAEKTAAQKCAADDLFDNGANGIAWANNPPSGRMPDPTPTQLSTLQQVVANCPGANSKVKLTKLIYYPPTDLKTKLIARRCAP